jgi:hypothetical protein
MTWGQLDATQWPPADPFFAAPIVPWKMNTGSGTFNTFRDWVRGHVTNGDTAFDPGSNTLDPCARTLDQASVNPTITNGPSFPLENDIKPLLNTPGLLGSSLSTVATSVDNPENWIHWASFGVYSAFPYTSTASLGGHTYAANAAAVNGKLPSTNIVTITYPITRILWNVTRKGDADCPGLVASGLPGGVRDCDFAGQPGPAIAAGGTDLNVTGASTGPGGAVREFVRWLCRANGTQQGKDPFTGVNYDGEITSAIQGAGFALVPAGFRTSGSRCDVNTDVLHAP